MAINNLLKEICQLLEQVFTTQFQLKKVFKNIFRKGDNERMNLMFWIILLSILSSANAFKCSHHVLVINFYTILRKGKKFESINSLTKDLILVDAKLKAFADDKINLNEIVLARIESRVGKGENAGY